MKDRTTVIHQESFYAVRAHEEKTMLFVVFVGYSLKVHVLALPSDILRVQLILGKQ